MLNDSRIELTPLSSLSSRCSMTLVRYMSSPTTFGAAENEALERYASPKLLHDRHTEALFSGTCGTVYYRAQFVSSVSYYSNNSQWQRSSVEGKTVHRHHGSSNTTTRSPYPTFKEHSHGLGHRHNRLHWHLGLQVCRTAHARK